MFIGLRRVGGGENARLVHSRDTSILGLPIDRSPFSTFRHPTSTSLAHLHQRGNRAGPLFAHLPVPRVLRSSSVVQDLESQETVTVDPMPHDAALTVPSPKSASLTVSCVAKRGESESRAIVAVRNQFQQCVKHECQQPHPIALPTLLLPTTKRIQFHARPSLVQ